MSTHTHTRAALRGLLGLALLGLPTAALAHPPAHAPAWGYRARHHVPLYGDYGDFDRDGVRNCRDRDIDGDGIFNYYDRNDWRRDYVSRPAYRPTYGPIYRSAHRPRVIRRGDHDMDRDGIGNRWDRDKDNDGRRNARDRDLDGDGRRNRRDDHPKNPRRR